MTVPFDIEYQTDDPTTVVLWLRTPAAVEWVEATGRQRVGLTLPVAPADLKTTLESITAWPLRVRPLRAE